MLKPLQTGLGPSRTTAREVLPGVLLAMLLAVFLRMPFLGHLAFPDEGGDLLVARQWRSGGPALYGRLFLDRPPLLVLFWRLADALGGVEQARVLATGGVVLLVGLAGWAGSQIGGARGARWSALTAAALAATPVLGTQEVNGELLAAPLTMASCALMLLAARRRWKPLVQSASAFGAGAAGAAAMLVKQNLADGLVFAAALALMAAFTRAWTRGAVLRVLLAGAVGVMVPVCATVMWASMSGPGLDVLWYTLYGFRADAADVIADHGMAAPDGRLLVLAVLAVVSGIVPLVQAYLWLARRRLRGGEPFAVALLAMLVVEVTGVLLGGSYWAHYLVGLVPGAALAAGCTPALLRGRRTWPRWNIALVVASAVVTTLVAASHFVTSPRSDEVALVAWLAKADRPGDTGMVIYGHPNIVEGSGLRPASYPYLWSLPIRTEDPRLHRLTATVSAPSGPTWIVEWMPFDAWHIDVRGMLARAVARHYRSAGTVCGVPVFLRDGADRHLPAKPAC